MKKLLADPFSDHTHTQHHGFHILCRWHMHRDIPHQSLHGCPKTIPLLFTPSSGKRRRPQNTCFSSIRKALPTHHNIQVVFGTKGKAPHMKVNPVHQASWEEPAVMPQAVNGKFKCSGANLTISIYRRLQVNNNACAFIIIYSTSVSVSFKEFYTPKKYKSQ